MRRKEWWNELTIAQVRLRLHVAEKRIHDKAKLAANEIASDAVVLLKKLNIVQ